VILLFGFKKKMSLKCDHLEKKITKIGYIAEVEIYDKKMDSSILTAT
jgi:hypothetical protein